MHAPRYRSSIARRVFLAVLICLCLLFFCAGAVVFAVVNGLTTASSESTSVQLEHALAIVGDQLLANWMLVAAGLALVLLVARLLAYWAVRPLNTLVSAAAAIAGDAQASMPSAGTAEAGELTRNFGELSELLMRSSQELEKQNKIMAESMGRLENLLSIGQELNVTLDPEQLLQRLANALHKVLGYECASAALVEGEQLSLFLDNTAAQNHVSPLRIAVSEAYAVGRAALTGAPVRVDDFRSFTGLSPSPSMPSAQAELALPVIHTRQVLAVVSVQSAQAGAFGPRDEEQVGLLVQMLASALANSSRLHDEQLRRQMAEAIYRVSQTLSGALVSERVPELILDQLAQVLPFDRSALLFVEGETIEMVATRGYVTTAVVSRSRIPVTSLPLIAEIVGQNKPLVLERANNDSRYRPVAGDAPAQSWLGAPLVRFSQVIGVLVLESDEPGRYGREEVTAMSAIANQAAIALENARLYTEAQDRAQRLEVITELSKLVSTHDVLRELHGILRTAIHRIRRVVPCDYAALALFNEDDETFTVETVYNFAVRDWAELPAGQRVAAEGTPWQMACRTGGPLLQSDLSRSAFIEDRPLAAQGLRASIVVPILGGQLPVGALTFASRDGRYGQVQVATLVELAHYLGPALHNARLNRERDASTSQLSQTQEYLNLVDKVRVVGQLASGVAHDFNNLLAGILGNAQLLLYEIQDPEQREMLRVIERAAKDGSETVRRLQGFARMEHDTPMTEVRLDMLARDAIDITRPRWRDVAQSRGLSIEIVRQLQPVTPIAGRPAELREVLTNLIINAVDAMPQGGRVTITTFDDLSADGQGAVVLEVADTGIGMPAEVQARIFDPFFTTKGEQGTGLGLAVSLGIIEGHGGQISVDSQIGQGTRFTIRLPVRAAEVASTRDGEGNLPPIQPGHLLLVESEPMIRESIVRLLTRWGHRVTQANGGIEALRLFQPEQFDLVISDLGMPDMSGWDVLAQVKQREPRVPTVLLTGWGRQYTDEEARERGADFIVEKPFDQNDLRRVLARAMNGK